MSYSVRSRKIKMITSTLDFKLSETPNDKVYNYSIKHKGIPKSQVP